MIRRRTFLAAVAAALAGCQEWHGIRYFMRGDPFAIPLVVSPVGPDGLGQWLGDQVIDTFVDAGFLVVGAHWPGLDGGLEDFGARHESIAPWLDDIGVRQPLLYAQSRGGLQLLNFACDHPHSVSAIAALYPSTDPFVYPGRTPQLWSAYGVNEARFDRRRFSPNLRARNLKGRPIKIWHGDRDDRVPKHLTTDVFARACGAEVVTLPGVGHAYTDLREIVAYLEAAKQDHPMQLS